MKFCQWQQLLLFAISSILIHFYDDSFLFQTNLSANTHHRSQYLLFALMEPADSLLHSSSNFIPHHPQNVNQSQIPQLPPQYHPIEEEYNVEYQQNDELLTFQSCFSPKDTAQSLKKRNDGLKMLSFDNSDEDPDEIYNKRKKKVQHLLNKQESLLSEIKSLKESDPGKFRAIMDFTKFICQVKQNVSGIRTDYYSNKTFCALKNSSERDLQELTSLMKTMYASSNKILENSTNSQSSSCKLEDNSTNKAIQFLIIPRFLISKDKIHRLIRDQTLQENFIFLVTNKCLGHYNNEANKKMPEEYHMKFVRQLLRKNDGRQKFKRICSINHGSRLLKNQSLFYYELYNKSLEYLKFLEQELKKGKKIENIRKRLEGMHFQSNQRKSFTSPRENDSSSNSVFSFGSMQGELVKIQRDPDEKNIEEELFDNQPAQFQVFNCMKKAQVKKQMSMPNEGQAPRKLGVKKSLTMEQRKATTIILVKPPFQI